MKMSYLLKSKPKREYPFKTIIAILLFLTFSLLGLLFPNATRTLFYNISRPFWSISGTIVKPISIFKDFFVLKSSIISENLSLRDEIMSLRLREIDYNVISKENEDLKSELGRVSNNTTILSNVLSKPPNSLYDTFIIDVGSLHGIMLGNKVYLSNRIIIGTIASVTSYTSIVKLFSSSGEKQETTLSRTGASFEIIGKGGANFQVEVPKDTDIVFGDSFIYSGISSSIIGNVYYIDTNSQSSFKTIYLRTPGNVFSTNHVFVEKNI